MSISCCVEVSTLCCVEWVHYVVLMWVHYGLLKWVHYGVLRWEHYVVLRWVHYGVLRWVRYGVLSRVHYGLWRWVHYDVLRWVHYAVLIWVHYGLLRWVHYAVMRWVHYVMLRWVHYAMLRWVHYDVKTLCFIENFRTSHEIVFMCLWHFSHEVVHEAFCCVATLQLNEELCWFCSSWTSRSMFFIMPIFLNLDLASLNNITQTQFCVFQIWRHWVWSNKADTTSVEDARSVRGWTSGSQEKMWYVLCWVWNIEENGFTTYIRLV